jgi:hypothetical protein
MAIALPEREENDQLSLEELERRLIQASDRFMRGEINVEQFEAAEQSYMPDYRSAFLALAIQQHSRSRARMDNAHKWRIKWLWPKATSSRST